MRSSISGKKNAPLSWRVEITWNEFSSRRFHRKWGGRTESQGFCMNLLRNKGFMLWVLGSHGKVLSIRRWSFFHCETLCGTVRKTGL